jgi:hypothetical protein
VVLQGIRREGCEGGLAEQRNILWKLNFS